MTYRVVKKINGSHYLYEQETYREGGKVRTRSQYLGAVDPVVIKKLKARGEPLEAALMPTEPETAIPAETETDPTIKYTVTAIDAEPLKTPVAPQDNPSAFKPRAKPKLNNTNNEKSKPAEIVRSQLLRIKAKVERHNISRAALEAEHRRFTRHMEGLGLKTDDIGRVLVGTGKKVRCRRQRSGNYVITIPRFKTKKTKGDIGPATRTAFKREYRKALAGTYLDAIKAQDPKYYARLEQNLSAAFKAQNKAIARYLMNSKRKPSANIGLTLHFYHSKMLSNWSKFHISSETLGLADHERRDGWRQDAIATMAEIQQRGWSQTYSKYMNELSKVESLTLRKLSECQKMSVMDRLSGKRRVARRELRKLNARRKALNEACNKISILAPLFQSYKDKSFDGRNPFVHETMWRDKLRRREQRMAREKLRESRPPPKQPPAGARHKTGGRQSPRRGTQVPAMKGRVI